jgi:DNA-binding MarR family transcriptional regulator
MNPDAHDPPSRGIADACARRLLETVPFVMRVIRQEMRGVTSENLSVPQFRILAFLGHHRGVSLATVAEHLGVADATASAMVERLVRRALVSRTIHPQERRRVVLDLTTEGATLLEQSRARARAFLAVSLAPLAERQLNQLYDSLEFLGQTLGPGSPKGERP